MTDWGLKSTEKQLFSWLPVNTLCVGLKRITHRLFFFFSLSKWKHPRTLVGSVNQNANLLSTEQWCVMLLCSPTQMHSWEGTHSYHCFLAGAQVLLGAGESTYWVPGKGMGRRSQLLPFPSWFPSTSTRRVTWGRLVVLMLLYIITSLEFWLFVHML